MNQLRQHIFNMSQKKSHQKNSSYDKAHLKEIQRLMEQSDKQKDAQIKLMHERQVTQQLELERLLEQTNKEKN